MVQMTREDISSHRGRLDIMADILDASMGGAKKTHLMYHCNLSFKQLKQYSFFLLNQGFLRLIVHDGVEKPHNGNGGTFELTDKGKQFLKAYQGLKALMQ